jgi:hypothetical protein
MYALEYCSERMRWDLFDEECKFLYLRDKEDIEREREHVLLYWKRAYQRSISLFVRSIGTKWEPFVPITTKKKIEEELNFTRKCDKIFLTDTIRREGFCRYTCVDLRDRTSILDICTPHFVEVILDNCLADVEGRTLEFSLKKDRSAFFTQIKLNRINTTNMVLMQYDKLKKTGCPKEYIFFAHTKRNDPIGKGNLIAYSDKERLFHTIDTMGRGRVCRYPCDHIFTCIDIRNLSDVRKYITTESVSDEELTQIVYDINEKRICLQRTRPKSIENFSFLAEASREAG